MQDGIVADGTAKERSGKYIEFQRALDEATRLSSLAL